MPLRMSRSLGVACRMLAAQASALRVELHRYAVLRRDFGATDAVEGGRRIGHLDEACKADAAVDALRAQPLLLGA